MLRPAIAKIGRPVADETSWAISSVEATLVVESWAMTTREMMENRNVAMQVTKEWGIQGLVSQIGIVASCQKNWRRF